MAKKFTKLTAGGGGLDINGVIEQYKVEAGANVNAGDFVEFVNSAIWGSGEFDSSVVTAVSACKLDNSKVLVAYSDGGSSNYGTAVILSISDIAITAGTPIVFASIATSYISTVALTDSKVLVAYSNASSSGYGMAVILSISDTTITVTADTVEISSSTYISGISTVALTDSKVLVSYRNYDSSYNAAVVLTISGTTINVGSWITFAELTSSGGSAVALTDSKVLLAYEGEISARRSYGTAIVLTISGTTITVGTSKRFADGGEDMSAVALTDSKVLVAYRDYDNSYYGTAVVLTISGTTITVGTPIVFERAHTHNISAVALTDSKVLVAYRDGGNSGYGTAIVLSISDTTITAGTPKVFDYNSTSSISSIAFSENSVFVAYNNGIGAYCGLTIEGTTIKTQDEIGGETFVKPATSRNVNVGVAKTSGAEGETVNVYCVSISKEE